VGVVVVSVSDIEFSFAAVLAAPQSKEHTEQLLHRSSRGHSERLVEKDGFGQFLTHQGEAAGKFGVGGERALDFGRVTEPE
jgi:hypothetical protein